MTESKLSALTTSELYNELRRRGEPDFKGAVSKIEEWIKKEGRIDIEFFGDSGISLYARKKHGRWRNYGENEIEKEKLTIQNLPQAIIEMLTSKET